MKHTLKNILKYLLIVLYLCYSMSTTMFIHTHYYEGQQVVHSHPFLMGEGGALNHTHTVSQSVFIHFISSTLLLAVSVSIGLSVLFIFLSKEFKQEIQSRIFRFVLCFLLRAPPVSEAI